MFETDNNPTVRPTRVDGVVFQRRAGGHVSRRKHQDRFVEVSQAIGQPIRTEEQLPSSRVVLDLLLPLGVVPGLLGAVGDEVAGHIVGIEHFSRPPTPTEAERALLKAPLLRNEFTRDRVAEVSLVIACRRTTGALRCYDMVPDAVVRGWWRLNMQIAQVHILSAQALPSDGSWGAFRFATNPPGPALQNLIAELLGDPRLTTLAKERLLEAVMENKISNVSEPDTRTAYRRAVDDGIAQGVAQLRRQQELILAGLSAMLEPAAVAALRSRLGTEDFGQALVEALAQR